MNQDFLNCREKSFCILVQNGDSGHGNVSTVAAPEYCALNINLETMAVFAEVLQFREYPQGNFSEILDGILLT